MKNKLLLTTALGAVALAGVANAETKITGQLDINYSASTHSTAMSSTDGWGRESQINVSNSGDLNNGMSYAAGFSVEWDGNGQNSAKADENLYIDFTTGNTTISVNQDHGQNSDSSAVPRVSINADSLSTTSMAYAQGAGIGNNGHQHVKEGMGVQLSQKFDQGLVSVRFTPEAFQDGGSNDGITRGSEGQGREVMFTGNLGVEGLSVNLQDVKVERAASSTHSPNRDSKGRAYSIGYKYGQFAVGAMKNDRELGNSDTEAYKSTEYGATFAASDNLSIGVATIKTDVNSSATDEDINQFTIGYNLGAVAVHLNYAEYDNVLGASGTNIETASLRLSTKF
jgi:hypothetical protein